MKITVKAVNTLAFGEEGIEFELPTKGLTLIQGRNLSSSSKTSNGCGKSSLLDIVLYGLYGSYPEKRKKADMVNDAVGKNSVVDMTVTIKGKVGRIIRTIKADEFEVNGVPIVGDTLAFFIDGEDCRGSSIKETQKTITEFFGIDEESFKAAAWLTADSESFAAKTPAQQDKLFLKLLRLEGLEEALKVTKNLSKDVDESLSEIVSKISSTKSNIGELERTIESLKSSTEEWKEKQQSKIDRLKSKEKSTLNQIEELEEDLVSYDKLLVELDEEEKNLEEPKENKEKLNEQITALEKEIGQVNSDLGGSRREMRNKEKLLKEAQSLNGGTKCPKCGTGLTEEHLFAYREEINLALDTLRIEESELQEDLHSLRQDMESYKSKVQEIVAFENNKRELRSKIRRTSDRKQNTVKNLETAKENLEDIQEELADVSETKPPQQKETASLDERIEELNNNLDELKSNQKSLLVEKDRLEFWIKGFGSQGIRNMLVRSTIPQLTRNANEFSKIMTDGELSISFSGEQVTQSGETRNKLNIQVSDEYGSDGYWTSSAGERRRIDICVSLALYMLVQQRVGLPFVFSDEIYQSVDGRGKELITKLLRYLLDKIPSIFIISNQDDISSNEFENVFTVIREGRQSRLEKE